MSSVAFSLSALESRTVRKVRWRIIPFIFVLYVIAFLDRINIGFAALTMNKELAITSQEFGLIAGVFFFGYFVFEVPSNLLMYRIGARSWIARILITWGFMAALSGLVHNVVQMCVARFLLGVAEAGFVPGILFYFTYWFRQKDLAQTISLLLTGLPVTTILGAPVSGLVLDHIHWFGVSSWRWLLILEALPAILGGVLTYFVLPNNPSEAKFLEPSERNWLNGELAIERANKEKHSISILETLTNRRVCHLAAINFSLLIGLYSLSFWLPQLVRSFSASYSNTAVGFLVALPQILGLMAMVWVSRSSDHRTERRYHAAIPISIAGLALAMLLAAPSTHVSMALLSVAVAGTYSFFGPFWSMPSEFLSGASAAVGIAFINSVGNLAGFLGPWAIGAISIRTGSTNLGLALAGISMLISAGLLIALPSALVRDRLTGYSRRCGRLKYSRAATTRARAPAPHDLRCPINSQYLDHIGHSLQLQQRSSGQFVVTAQEICIENILPRTAANGA